MKILLQGREGFNPLTGCHRKAGYRSLETAMRVARERSGAGVNLNIYRCPNCRDYHLTKRGGK